MRKLTARLRELDLRGESGQSITLFAVFLPLVLAISALAIDGSLAFVQRTSMQNAADAAALAAAQDITVNGCGACATDAADYLNKNGVTAPSPLPACGPNQAPPCYVWPYVDAQAAKHPDQIQVKVQQNYGNFFGRALAKIGIPFDPSQAAAQAVGGLTTGKAPDITFAALNSSNDNHTLVIRSGGTLTVNNKVYVNSASDGDGFDIFGTGGKITAPEIDTHGGWESHDSGQVLIGGSTSPCPYRKVNASQTVGTQPGCPKVGQPLLVDPFAGLVIPPTPDPTNTQTNCTVPQPCYSVSPYSPAQYVASGNLAAGASTFTLQGSALTQNSYISIDGERMKVTKVTGQQITVLRGALGSTAQDHTLPALDVVGAQRIGGTSVLVTDQPHGLSIGDTIEVDLSGSFSSFNGTYTITDIPDDEQDLNPVELAYQQSSSLPDVGGVAIVSVARKDGVSTVVTSSPHGLAVGDHVEVQISSTDPTLTSFDVTEAQDVTVTSVPSPTIFTYAQAGKPDVLGTPVQIDKVGRFAGTATIDTSGPHGLSTGQGAFVSVPADSSFDATTTVTAVDNNTFSYASPGPDVSTAKLAGAKTSVTQMARSGGISTLTANPGSLAVNDWIAVNLGGTDFDGIYQVTAVDSTAGTVTYAQPSEATNDVPVQAADTGAAYEPAIAVATVARANGVATVTTSAAHGLSTGDYVTVDVGDNSFDGTVKITKVDNKTFTYASPGSDSTAATTTGAVAKVSAGALVDVSQSGNCNPSCSVTPFQLADGTLPFAAVTCCNPGDKGTGAASGPLFQVFSVTNPTAPITGGTSPTAPAAFTIPAGTPAVLSPGTYYGGICIGAPAGKQCGNNVSGSCIPSSTTGATVTMQPGVYIMAGGGFFVCGNASLDASQGVTIYNTVDSAASTGAAKLDQVQINTNGTVLLAPSQTGSFIGLTVYQGPDSASSATPNPDLQLTTSKCDNRPVTTTDVAFTHSANGLNGISGTVYAPAQYALFADRMTGTANLAVIAGCIFIDGANSTFQFNAAGGLFGRAPGLIH